jgi:hypothetical protein
MSAADLQKAHIWGWADFPMRSCWTSRRTSQPKAWNGLFSLRGDRETFLEFCVSYWESTEDFLPVSGFVTWLKMMFRAGGRFLNPTQAQEFRYLFKK